MQSPAIDDIHGICGTVLNSELASHLVKVYQVRTKRRISQQKFQEENMRWVGVRFGEALTLGWIPQMF